MHIACYNDRLFILKQKGRAKDIESENDLRGKIVATQSGSNSEDYVNGNAELKESFAAFKTYRDLQEGFAALEKGEYDVLIVDEIAGRYELSKHPKKFELIDVTIGEVTEFGIGFGKDNVKLRDKVQQVFDEMIADGTAERISEKWFGLNLIKSAR